MLLFTLAQRGTEEVLHNVHASEDDDRRENGVGVLVEGWVL